MVRRRLLKYGLNNVHLLRADVGRLPVSNDLIDFVLSMNGLHVFPDKSGAVAEMRRVARERGKLVACGYASGGRKLTDWFVKHFVVPRGFFSSPFFDINNICTQLEGFSIRSQRNFKSFVWVEAVKD